MHHVADAGVLARAPRRGAAAPGPWARQALAALILGLACAHAALAAEAGAADPATGTAVLPPLDLLAVIRQTLLRNPAIRLQQQQVEIARGALQQSAGGFDPSVQLSLGRRRDQQPLNAATRAAYDARYGSAGAGAIDTLVTETGSATATLEKTWRSGVVLSMSASSIRTDGTGNALEGWPPQTVGTIGFSLSLPLGRNAGTGLALGERASGLAWQASLYDLRQALAKSVLDAVQAYWGVLAARRHLEIAREGEASSTVLLEDTRKLVAADELPAAELDLVRASLAERQAARIAAEDGVQQAVLALAGVLGLAWPQVPGLRVEGELPPQSAPQPGQLQHQPGLLEAALRRRADLSAARLRLQAADAEIELARSGLRAQHNLVLGAGAARLAEGRAPGHYLQALRPGAPNWSIAWVYQMPLGDNAAQGVLAQRLAAREKARIGLDAQTRSIALAVEAAHGALLRSTRQLQASMESVTIYQRSLENEKTRNRLGTSTMLNVLNVADSLRNARYASVQYHASLLNALASLAYETGALLPEDADAPPLRAPTTAVPGLAAGQAGVVDLSRLTDPAWALGAAR